MKSHRFAVAAVPPQEAWEPIQEVRRVHDRQLARWMPHVNLLYPFVEADEGVMRSLEEAARRCPCFDTTLAQFRFFLHPSGSATVWLAPEPREPLVRLQEALVHAFPACDDLSRFEGGFTPHLSVGQCRGEEEARRLISRLQSAWRPSRFTLRSLALLRRGADTPFDVAREFPLG